MGTTFRYVADGALEPCGGTQCHHCECSDRPIYFYTGEILDPEFAANPDLAREEPDVSELCAECIRGGNVRKDAGSIEEIVRTAEALATDPTQALEEFHRTPDVTFIQGDVWPVCCGEFAEYVGKHPTEGTTFDDYEPWQPMNWIVERHRLADFYPLDKLPVLYTMALFRCHHCPKRFWVFQYSGLLWRGPLSE